MATSTLTWYKSQTKKIMKGLNSVKQKQIATELNESPQTINYRMHNVYPGMFEDALRLLALAGYEVVEKEEVEVWRRIRKRSIF